MRRLIKIEKSRIALWDNLKFVLIALVVVGHFAIYFSNEYHLFKSVYLFLYAFHMPVFFFISGMFHSNKNISKKITAYFSIYVVSKILFFFIKLIFSKKAVFSVLTEDSLPWFMFVTAVFIGLTYLLRNTNKTFVFIIGILLALFAGYDKQCGDFLMLSRIIVFFPVYTLGTMVSRESLEKLSQRKALKLTGFLILLIWALICFYNTDKVAIIGHLFSGRNPFNDSLGIYGGLYRLLTYFITAVTGFALILCVPEKPLGILTKFGQRTLQIYFWHYPFITVAVKLGLAEIILSMAFVGKYLWLIAGVALTFLLALKPFGFPVNQLLKAPYKDVNKDNK